MKSYKGTHVAMIGVGFLLEYIFPCVRQLVGEENVAACVMGTSADEAAIPGKEQRLGIRVLYKDNARMLREIQPQIILYGPQPVFAAELAQSVLKPYYDELRAAGRELPDLYVAPPSPVGKFYRELLGQDVHVVNMLPNMLTKIAGQDVAKQGVTAVTYAQGDRWPEEKKTRLHSFFAPYGRTVEVPCDQVMTFLGGQCALQAVTEYVHTIYTAVNRAGCGLTHQKIASAMRALFRARYRYEFPSPIACDKDDVPAKLHGALEKVVVTLYEGVADACMELGMSRRVVDESMISWLDLHLCTLQTEERSDTVRQTANHATKGGVAEMGLRVYYQRIDYPLTQIFSDPDRAQEAFTPELAARLRDAAAYNTKTVQQHGGRLGQGSTQKIHVEQHAMMYALLARAADTYLKDRADGAIHEATVLYGRQRGQRMRARALEKGIPLDMAGYFALREWNPDPGDFDSETEQKAPCLITRQKLCPWTQAWKLFSMEKYGALYCRDVDWAILNGFEPSLRLELESTLSAGACCCRFTYPQACQDAAFEAQQEKWAALAGADAVQPFAYHTAHVYCAFRQVMRDYGEAGEKVMEQAQADFKSYYTERVWNEIAAYFGKFQ